MLKTLVTQRKIAMDPKKYKFTRIKDGIPIPVPRDLTKEEEMAILAQARMEFDPVASEAECRELLRQREQGLLVSAEELLDQLESLDGKSHRESA
jgi:hypothetical protein